MLRAIHGFFVGFDDLVCEILGLRDYVHVGTVHPADLFWISFSQQSQSVLGNGSAAFDKQHFHLGGLFATSDYPSYL